MAVETAAERDGARAGTGGGREPGPRGGVALVVLWLLAGVLAFRQAAVVLRQPPEERLTDLLTWIGDNGILRAPRDSLYDGTVPFTETPFTGLVLTPLTRGAAQSLGVAWTFGTLLLVIALAVVAARRLPGAVSPRTRLLAVPVAISLLAVSVPVRNTFTLGQTSILPVLLVLTGLLVVRSQRGGGALIGVAAALQPAVLLFAPLLWLTRRRHAAVSAGIVFGGCTLAAWIVMPGDSATYWVHHIAGAGLGEPADAAANQSLHGALLRLGLRGPLETVLFVVLAAVVVVLALRRAVRYALDGQLLLAAAVVGCAVVAISPTAWQHQLLWVLLAVAGRVGRRTGDRLVWPAFVVLVMSLDGQALVPKMEGLAVFRDNAPLLAALLAACVVPFLSRGSELWDRPVPSGLLSRPNVMLELLLIRVWYWAYSWVRAHAPGARDTAEAHGDQILAIQAALRLDMEHALNQWVARTGWLEDACNFYYSTFHFLVPLSLLALLYMRRPLEFRRARTALGFATLLGLVGFWLYPLAPPRLMPGLGYIDTAHGPQDFSDPDFGALTEMSNQYAAMPSLHVGWSLWCAVVVVRMTPNLWLRALGIAYPLLTTFVVMATANHYLLDAVGGAAVVAAGFGLQALLFRLRGTAGGGDEADGEAAGADLDKAHPGGADPGGADPARGNPAGVGIAGSSSVASEASAGKTVPDVPGSDAVGAEPAR